MKARRLSEMEAHILRGGEITMEDLCARFCISMNTARRDVKALVGMGSVEKVYGGVRAARSGYLTPYDARALRGSEEKTLIGRLAASMIENGDTIFLDSGTTTPRVLDALAQKSVTVVTNNVYALYAALKLQNVRLIALPGVLQRDTASLTGPETVRALEEIHVSIAFMAATGIKDGKVTNSSPMEFEIKRAAMRCAERAALLADGSKLYAAGLLKYADLADFDCLITDARAGLPEGIRVLCPEGGRE